MSSRSSRSSRSRSEESEGEGETVWVAPNPWNRADCYHTDQDCHRADPERYLELSRERAVRRYDLRECEICAGTAAQPGPRGGHYQALLAAAESDDGAADGGE